MSEDKHLRPRRGTRSLMTTTSKSALVLEEGEIFVECPDGGVGTGKCKVKIGDGVTAYAILPYALGDSLEDAIYYIEDQGNDIQILLNQIEPGVTIGTFVSKIKRIAQLLFNKFSDYYTTTQMDTIINNINGRLDGMYTKSQIDDITTDIFGNIHNIQSDLADEYYNKYQVDNMVSGFYTKSDIDGMLQTINNSINTVDNKFSNYYTKTQTDSLVRIKVVSSDPANPEVGEQWILKN